MPDQPTVDVYPVGLLADLRIDWRNLRNRKALRAAGVRPSLRIRWTVRHLIGCMRAGNWRAVKNTFNGYLAEPRDWPEGLRRCGSGWTRKRALRSLERHIRAGGTT